MHRSLAVLWIASLILALTACDTPAIAPTTQDTGGESPDAIGSEAATATARPSVTPTSVALDPECQAAFASSIETMIEGSFGHLDAAIAACDTVEDWRAAARLYPDAAGFRIMQGVYERCSGFEALQETALCEATRADWATE